MTHMHLQSFFIENKNVGNKADSEDWRSQYLPWRNEQDLAIG
jgi:hypothetical protein